MEGGYRKVVTCHANFLGGQKNSTRHRRKRKASRGPHKLAVSKVGNVRKKKNKQKKKKRKTV